MEVSMLNNLEEKISQLEAAVLPSHESEDGKLLKVLGEVNDTLEAFSSKRERFNQIFKNVPFLLDYLKPGFIDIISMNKQCEKELVLSVSNDIEEIAKQFEEIDKLSASLDSKKIPQIISHEQRLANLETIQQQHLNTLSQSSEDLNHLLTAYNQMVSQLSQMFVNWDLLLSKLEEEQDE